MTETKRALLTGITGQDGSYLAELLLSKGYEVHGIIRRTSTFNTDRIDHIYQDPHLSEAKLFLHYGDLADGVTLRRLLELVQPHEIYNLGAQSPVRVSFDAPEYTVDIVAMGALRLLEAIRDYEQRTKLQVRYYQAGSSEMYGLVQEVPQSETTPFYPRHRHRPPSHGHDARLESPLGRGARPAIPNSKSSNRLKNNRLLLVELGGFVQHLLVIARISSINPSQQYMFNTRIGLNLELLVPVRAAHLVQIGYGAEESKMQQDRIKPDRIAPDLVDSIDWILTQSHIRR